MKYYITYFYNIRFLKPNMVPFSTAVWDPKYFHDFKGSSYTFIDKRGVINGLRVETLQPQITNNGGCPCNTKHPESCLFLKNYEIQLENTNFKELTDYLEAVAYDAKEQLKFQEEPEIVLLVYEKPDNPCSERGPLIKYFAKNGIQLKEFQKEY